MREKAPVRRYALARPGAAGAHPAEGVRRLRLVRMEEIAERERAADPAAPEPGRPSDQPDSRAPSRS